MNLASKLLERASASGPVRVGIIGAGKFGSMVLSQAQKIEGFHVVGVVDLSVAKARESMQRVGWPRSAAAPRAWARRSAREPPA